MVRFIALHEGQLVIALKILLLILNGVGIYFVFDLFSYDELCTYSLAGGIFKSSETRPVACVLLVALSANFLFTVSALINYTIYRRRL